MQGMGLGPRPPSIPIPNAVVDDPEVGKIYWIHLKYPHDLNGDSPVSIPIPPSSDLEWQSIQAPSSSGNARTASRHCGLLIHFDSVTKIGALFLGSGQRQPQQPHKFVPWYGTLRLPRQPPDPLVPDPPCAFDQFPGFLNFSHLIQARVLQRSEVGVGTFIPGLVYINEIVAGDILHTYLPGDSMAYLKELHDRYWAGIRYNDVQDTILPGSGGGPSGGGGSSGGRRSMTRSMTSGASGQGQASGKWKKSSARAERVHDPIDPATGLSHSMRMKIANLEAEVADKQVRLSSGEMEVDGGVFLVALLPLVDPKLCDPFPFHLVARGVPLE